MEWNPFLWTGIPDGFQVHHVDFHISHNCRQNLCVMDAVIHAAISRDAKPRHPYTGQYISREEYRKMTEEEPPF